MTFQPLKLILSIKDGGFRTRQGNRAIDVTGNNDTDAGDLIHTKGKGCLVRLTRKLLTCFLSSAIFI